jgi:hypothetical protein
LRGWHISPNDSMFEICRDKLTIRAGAWNSFLSREVTAKQGQRPTTGLELWPTPSAEKSQRSRANLVSEHPDSRI